ncbi:MAG: antibiotic biosynthesis monooxygenase [Burkholderiaceae bacterium]|jgi:autoinducer 2-degrading protein|nr:antibiotic biosynthesis monooxygenase [Burkholderiaceae bacterium]
MHVVTVVFTIHATHYPAFLQAMVGNARTSLQDEPGCRQFDVCESPSQPGKVFLYEIYDTEADFQAHLAAPHFLQFNALTAPWVAGKLVEVYRRAWP